jgi:hypothetical protein
MTALPGVIVAVAGLRGAHRLRQCKEHVSYPSMRTPRFACEGDSAFDEAGHVDKNYKVELYLLQAQQDIRRAATEALLIARSKRRLLLRGLVSCTYRPRSSVKPSSRVIRFPPVASPQAFVTPAAAGPFIENRTTARVPETDCIDAPRANRASAEAGLPRVLDTPDARPRRRMRRYRAWTDSTRAIVACT